MPNSTAETSDIGGKIYFPVSKYGRSCRSAREGEDCEVVEMRIGV